MRIVSYIKDPPLAVFVFFLLLILVAARKCLRKDHFYMLVISSLLSFLMAEGACRFLNIGNSKVAVWKEEYAKGEIYAYKPNGVLLYHYPDNPRGYFNEENKVSGTINAKGFRGKDKAFKKTNGITRIAFLGDSFTLGIGVKDNDTFPARVEFELNQYYDSIEVLNFGVSGFDTSDEINYLEKYVLRFKPDIVVIVLFLNDATRAPTMGFLVYHRFFVKVRKYSYFINALVGSIEKPYRTKRMINHYHKSFSESAPGYQSVKSALRKGKLLSDEHQFKFIVTIYPVLFKLDKRYPFKSIHQDIEIFCNAENIQFVDLFNRFEGKRDKELWVHSIDLHPNEEAHRLAALELTDFFLKERLIGKEYFGCYEQADGVNIFTGSKLLMAS